MVNEVAAIVVPIVLAVIGTTGGVIKVYLDRKKRLMNQDTDLEAGISVDSSNNNQDNDNQDNEIIEETTEETEKREISGIITREEALSIMNSTKFKTGPDLARSMNSQMSKSADNLLISSKLGQSNIIGTPISSSQSDSLVPYPDREGYHSDGNVNFAMTTTKSHKSKVIKSHNNKTPVTNILSASATVHSFSVPSSPELSPKTSSLKLSKANIPKQKKLTPVTIELVDPPTPVELVHKIPEILLSGEGNDKDEEN